MSRKLVQHLLVTLSVSVAMPLFAQEPAAEPAAPAANPAPAAETQPSQALLADQLPSGALVYVAWPGIQQLSEAAGDTQFAKLLDEPEIKRFRQRLEKDVLPAIEALIRSEMGGQQELVAIQAIRELVAQLYNHPFVFTFLDLRMDMQAGPQVDVALVIQAGQDAASLETLVMRLLTMAGMQVQTANEISVPGGSLKEVPIFGPNLMLRWGKVDNKFIVTTGNRLLSYLMTEGAAPSLAEGEGFALVSERAGVRPDCPAMYMDVKRFVMLMQMVQPMLSAFGTPGVGQPNGMKQFVEQAGLDRTESFMVSMVPDGEGFKTTTFTHYPNVKSDPPPGLIQKPLTDAELAVVPKDVRWASVMKLNVQEAYTQFEDTLSIMMPQGEQMLAMFKEEVLKRIGVRLEEDIVAAFGDTWALFEPTDAAGLWFVGTTLVVDVKEHNKLDKVLRNTGLFIAEMAGPDVEAETRTEAYRDVTINYLNISGAPVPVAPACAQYNQKWIFAMYPQIVRVALDQLIDGDSSLVDNEDYKKVRSHLPDDLLGVSYADSRPFIKFLYGVTLPAAQATLAMGQSEGIPADIGMWPSAPTLMKHLFGTARGHSLTDDGVLQVSYSSLPAGEATIGGPVAIGAVAGVMGARSFTHASVPHEAIALATMPANSGGMGARGNAQITATVSQLKKVGTACYMYAVDHDGKFPESLEALTKGDKVYLRPEDLHAPLDPRDEGVSFVYIAGQTDDGSDNIVAYLNPAFVTKDRVPCLFVDSHVETLPMRIFRQELAQTYERLGIEPVEEVEDTIEATVEPVPDVEPSP